MARTDSSCRQLALSAATSLLNLYLATSHLPLASSLSIPEQLLRIFNPENSDQPSRTKLNWTGIDHCSWDGIQCHNERSEIKTIDLSGKGLVGTITDDIWKISDLEILELQYNPFLDINFNGIADATSLEKLGLSNTGITSFYGLDSAPCLKELHLTGSSLEGTIPDQIYELTSLEGFYANYNSFTGSISDKVGQLTELKYLFLFDNDIAGTLPDSIGNMGKLELLVLSHNILSGPLPGDALNRLKELQMLALNRDYEENRGGITGPLPSLASLEKLTELYVQNNLITGIIPTNFLQAAPKQEQMEVDISDNLLTGILGSALKKFDLMLLTATGNKFSGFDQNICKKPNWMNGEVKNFGCSAIACPVNTFAREGRATYYGECSTCLGSHVIGAYDCATADNQRATLDAFYWAVDGPNWEYDDWEDEEHECNWSGIECNTDQDVTEINLSSNNLSGIPGPAIFKLPRLRALDLSNNLIEFRFDGISNAKNLESLTLYGTGLVTLDDIDQLSHTSVKELYISANKLEGSIPESIYDLVYLEVLMLSFNNFNGNISQDIEKLSNLRILRAYGNNLTGNIPSQFGLLKKLNELVLSENDLTGSIPVELSDMPNLEEISIHQTTNINGGLTGTLPDFANCKKLSTLHLNSNSIAGPLPDDFLKFTEVKNMAIEVDLSDNKITGAIPSDWAHIPYLEIELTNNKIVSISSGLCENGPNREWQSGIVESYGCNAILCDKETFNALGKQMDYYTKCEACPSSEFMGATQCGDAQSKDAFDILESLYISTNGQNWNNTEGWLENASICDWYGVVCEGNKVIKITLSNNGLTGKPSTDLYALSKLKELNLESNNIDFDFMGIEGATELETLYLSSTQITSLKGIGGGKELTTLHLTDSYLSGPIPDELYGLTKLEQLFLNYNQFSGRLSSKVGDLINLESLYLTGNQLSGPIPNHIGYLNKLKILALAENSLDGTIPEEINNLTYLEILSLQREMGDGQSSGLSGTLPNFNKLAHLEKLYLGYNDLSGTIPQDFLNSIEDKSKPIEVDLISNSLSGTVPSSLNRFTSLNIFLVDNNFIEIAPGLCSMTQWMNKQVAIDSCDAIMCAPNTYSEYGRKKDDNNLCVPCPQSTSSSYWGSFSCITEETVSEQREHAILEMLYTSMGGKNWHLQENWMNSEVNICEWQGITCTSVGVKSVTAIRLANNALTGEVPTAIFDLENLRDLNLSQNNISLKLDNIGSAKKLQYLDLDDTGIDNLDGIESATSLQILHISNNQFNEFPGEILSLHSLATLIMSYNSFGTSIPDLRQLTETLIFFECDQCGFKGVMPEWLNGFVKLEHLSLAGNTLTGSIPMLESMSLLRHLDLSDQISRGGGIDGNVPAFSSLKHLSELYLHKNKLDGSIPEDFLLTSQNDYIRVDLRKNMVEGAIPAVLFERFYYLTLLLANNKISMIPETICGVTSDILEWNGGDMNSFGCDGLLCHPGYYSESGRETETSKCVKCNEEGFTTFYGSTSCGLNSLKDILSSFYYSLGGADWEQNDNWTDTEDVCKWYGIECNSGSVVAISLEENGLSGKVPIDLFEIPTLTEINLKVNDISFSFEGIEKLTRLEILALSDTGITSIEGISKLSDSLTELHLTDNSLSTFPEELYDMTNLKTLYLNYNDIESSFSSRLGDMTSLEQLFMFENKMKGSLPTEIGQLQNLKSIALGGNFFTGHIPTELNKLKNLKILAIQKGISTLSEHKNGLIGNLPAFDNLPNIREIYLANQDISGPIPETFLGAVNDTNAYILVDLSMNSIQGSLPFSLKKFENMDIYLGGNEIENIDDSFCSLSNWMGGGVGDFGCNAILCPTGTYNVYGKQNEDDTTCTECPFTFTAMFWGSTSCSADATDYNEREILSIFYDNTGGSSWSETSNWKEDSVSICDWYGVHCASEDDSGAAKVVKQIQLSSNKLTGTVPPQIFGLKHLETLNLGDNHIDFEFHGIGQAMMLTELYLDSTDISDIDGIGEAKHLRNLHLEQNEFGGSIIPESLFQLSKLKHLYMSDANFGGKLPHKIGLLTSLEDFYCHGNELTGTIPTEIGNLDALEVLVLSENRFIGPIPNEINNLSVLQSLYIDSFTRRNAGLSGPLPSFSGMTALQEIYLGSNSLTGFFPDDFLSGLTNKDEKVTVGLRSNRLEGTLPSSLSSLSMLDIDISDNFITGIDGELCLMEKWNKGGVDTFKCNALLCPAGHFNQFGYQLNERSPCKKCGGLDESTFLGATICQSEVKQRERQILEALYHACGGLEWKHNENWLDNEVDICNWYGISCRNGGTVDTIVLGSNNLVGTPPSTIFDLPNLKWLWLYSNPIKFSFHDIDRAQQLTSLLLDSTGLDSIEGIGKAYQLSDLDLRFNRLSGSLPTEINQLINLESLSLTENYFTGTIPGLSRFHRLKSLRMGENMFSGPLPDFSTHNKLKTLDCSGNIITGTIPETFLASVGSDKDMFIDLSSNRLTGDVPGSLDRFDKMTLLLRDNFISGVDPELCDNGDWNDGDIGLFECDGLLCPPGTYADSKGRQSNDGTQCIECKEAQFYGQSRCLDLTSAYANSGASKSLSVGLITSLLVGWSLM